MSLAGSRRKLQNNNENSLLRRCSAVIAICFDRPGVIAS
jgi:hypothetical protein